MPALEIRQIAALYLVAETRSFSRAAAALGTIQPTLSRLVASAETAIGAGLFRRGWSGAEPTSAGEVVLMACKAAILAIDQAEAALYAPDRPHPALRSTLRIVDLAITQAVMETGSTRLAAAQLGLGQPEVSRALSHLAARLGLPLFRRGYRGMEPLPAARVLARLLGAVQSPFLGLTDRLHLPAGQIAGRVALGILPFSGQPYVARAFATLTNLHPRLRLVGVPGSYPALVEALRRREIDLIIGILRQEHCPPDLTETLHYTEQFTVVARVGHPSLLGQQTLGKLAQANWVVAPHGTPVRAHFDRLFAGEGLAPPTQSVEMLSFDAAEQMLAQSNSLGMLTYSVQRLRSLPPGLRQVALALPSATAPIGLVRLADCPPDAALVAFEQALADVLGKAGEVAP
jgi:LysR family transcriptional regulator, regulator for genes of the gallate degradation pathway